MRKITKRRRAQPKGFIVAIDGPAGAGKSTVSRKLADALDGMLLDTGGMYRSVAYQAVRDGVAKEDDLAGIAKNLEFDVNPETRALTVGGVELGSKLRTPEVSEMASKVSTFRKVRKILTTRQRSLARKWSKLMPVVVEGRDIGTIVFPHVPFKFYVTADAEIRARRRLKQLRKQGVKSVTLKEVLRDNDERDLQDSNRKLAPLKCPEDAVIVDTSSMRIGQVVRFMRDHIHGRSTLPNIERHS